MKLKKALSTLLTLVLLLSCMSITAFADGTTSISYKTPVYSTEGNASSGIASWTTATQNNVTVATADNISTGGWLAVTGNVTIDGTVNVSNDLNLYIASSATFQCNGFNAAGYTVTLYGEGTFSCNDTITASTFVFNGPTLSLYGAGTIKGTTEHRNGYDGHPAITGNVVLNAGSGTIAGGCGGEICYDGITEDNEADYNWWSWTSGNGGNCVAGSLLINGSSVLLRVGNGGGGDSWNGSWGSNGKLANDGSLTISSDVALYQNSNFVDDLNGLSYSDSAEVCEKFPLNASSSLNTQGGVSFSWKTGSSATKAPRTAKVTATVTPVDGYTVALTAVDADKNAVALTKGTADNTYTFTMPAKAVTVTATYTPVFALTSAASGLLNSEDGGVSFTVDSKAASDAAEKATVTATAKTVDGYTVALTAVDADKNAVALTKGTADNTYTFTMPAKAVTVTATYSKIITGTIDLDLEDSTADIPVSKDIDQYYTKTTASKTVTNNRISIAYSTPVVTIRVSDAQKWNPKTLKWEVDTDKNGEATVVTDTNVTTFTLKNYSINKFTCTMGFTPTDSKYFEDTAVTFDANNGTDIAAIETGTDGNGAAKYYKTDGTVDTDKVPTLTITGTLNIKTSAFKNATATSANVQYGNYTITCTKVAEN